MATGSRLERPQRAPPSMPDMAGPPPVASDFGAFRRPSQGGGLAGLLGGGGPRIPPWMVLPFGDDSQRPVLVMQSKAPARALGPAVKPPTVAPDITTTPTPFARKPTARIARPVSRSPVSCKT